MANIIHHSIDHEVLSELREMSGDMFRQIIETYLVDGADYMSRIEDALASNNIAGTRKAAHALKSASGQVGALRLQATLAPLEDAGDNNSSGNQKIFINAKAEYEMVRSALSQVIK